MEEMRNERKARKKAFKKAKHRAVRPWKGLSIFSGILAVVLVIVSVIFTTFDNTIAIFIGGTFYGADNEDESAQYFTSDFDTVEEMQDYGTRLCEQVEAEGAALLMNENQALPLEKNAAVSLFSNSSVNPVYGGTGSGNIDASAADSFKDAFQDAGFSVNEKLWDFYLEGAGSEYVRETGSFIATESATSSEVPWDVYTDDVKKSVEEYGDAAVVVLSRVGGEGADLEAVNGNYLALDENEIDLLSHLSQMKKDGTIKKIVVLINSANTLQLDFLQGNPYSVDACLWIGDVGVSGINAVADILSGEVTPSGSLVDTYCYDNYSSPAMANFNPVQYGEYKEGLIDESASYYSVYQEGIYVGYKYYETRYEDYVMGTGNAGAYAYDSEVAYPFGYGLSYTDFAYSNMSVSYNETSDQFQVSVTVTNTGDTYTGKETVQVYSQSPYTRYDIENGVEKPAAALCGFAKTKALAPGESQTVTANVDKSDLASFDTYGAGTYILDEGDYYLTIATDAHNAVNNTLAAKGYTVANTDGRMDADGNAGLVYQWNNPTFDATTYATSANGSDVTNQLSVADLNLYEGSNTKVTYLSRNDWTTTFPTAAVDVELTEQMVDDLQTILYDATDHDAVDMPTLEADNGLKLYDMIGLELDDPKWEALLDQMTFDEMVSLIGDSFHWTMPIESVQAPATRDENGPQGLTASLMKDDSLIATAFTSEDVMAATFNTQLMTEIGKVIGNNCLEAGVSFLYGTGNNIHRTPYGGRNFEYYSEDGYLSGEMCAYETAAIQAKGVNVEMKHFALNDSENKRMGICIWTNEQAAREIYLEAYKAPIEEADGNGVMISYTRWGCVWSGGVDGLVNGILRGEWGCDGMIITDNAVPAYLNGPDSVMAGVSTFDAMMPTAMKQLRDYENDPVIVTAMREACHYNLYAIANSCAMNGIGKDTTIKAVTPAPVAMVKILAIIFSILFVVSLVLFIRKKRIFKTTEDYSSYMEYKKSMKK